MEAMSELGLRELGPLIDRTLGSVLASPPLRATPAHRRRQPGTLTLQTEGNKDGVPSARQPARRASAHPGTSPPTRASVLRVRSAPRIGPGPIRGDRTPG